MLYLYDKFFSVMWIWFRIRRDTYYGKLPGSGSVWMPMWI